jgi:hypothetical protein
MVTLDVLENSHSTIGLNPSSDMIFLAAEIAVFVVE